MTLLAATGCDEIQGFLFARPMKADAMLVRLSNHPPKRFFVPAERLPPARDSDAGGRQDQKRASHHTAATIR